MRKPNKKSWFAVIGKISKTKLGYKEDEIIEIMNLKDAPDEEIIEFIRRSFEIVK